MSRKTLSLSNELSLMIDALGGVHRLTRHWIENYGMDLDDVPQSIGSLLVILRERLRLLDRVVRGTLDPRVAWCAENDAEGSPGDPNEEDVRLAAWSDGKLARHHRVALKRAKVRRALRRAKKENAEAREP
jgi:hypothetical protein